MVSCRHSTGQGSFVKAINSLLGFEGFATEESKVLMRQGGAPALR